MAWFATHYLLSPTVNGSAVQLGTTNVFFDYEDSSQSRASLLAVGNQTTNDWTNWVTNAVNTGVRAPPLNKEPFAFGQAFKVTATSSRSSIRLPLYWLPISYRPAVEDIQGRA